MYICSHSYRNPKTLETLDDSLGPGTKLLFTFLSLRFFDMKRERDTQFLTMLTFPSDPTTCGTPPQTTCLASASSENRLASSKSKSQLTVIFKFQNPQPIASVHDVIHVPGFHILSGVFIVTSVIVTSAPHAREHLHSMCAPN